MISSKIGFLLPCNKLISINYIKDLGVIYYHEIYFNEKIDKYTNKCLQILGFVTCRKLKSV